jgi:3-deoxy-7-phosphoheptulonate synthase
MRGYIDNLGHSKPNYHFEDLMSVYEEYQKKNLAHPAIIVDTNHANSNKQYLQQVRIAKDIMHSRHVSSEIRGLVKGLMTESYIEDGAQKIGEGVYGKSITDPCLGWEKTEQLLLELAELV